MIRSYHGGEFENENFENYVIRKELRTLSFS